MKIDKLIRQLERIRSEKGVNIEVFVLDDYRNPTDIGSADVYVADKDEFPKEWNMPKEYVVIE